MKRLTRLSFFKTGNNIELLIRTFSYLKPYLSLEFLILIITLVSTLISLSMPYFMKILIDDVIIKHQLFLFKKIMIILTLILFVQTLTYIIHSYLTIILSNKIVYDTNKEVYSHLLKLPLGYFSKTSGGETMSKMMNDIGSLQGTAQNFFLDFLFDSISIIIIIIILFHLNYSLALVSLTTIPFFALAPKMFGKKLYSESKLIQEKLAILTKTIQESISGISTIKSFLKEKFALEKYKRLWNDFLKFTLKRAIRKTFATEIIRIFTFLGPLTVLWYGGWLCFENELSIGSLIAFYSYLLKLYSPVSSVINSQLNLHISAAGIKRIFNFLDEKIEESDIKNNNEIEIKEPSIKFIDVDFEFEDRNFILSKINFSVEANSSLGIVGLTGSGKTTLINLLCRYYNPKNGIIEIGNYNIKQIPIFLTRKEIAVIPQEPFIFNSSILDNLTFANEDASLDEIEEACNVAQIHDFIISLPQKYDTIVGDRGITLSTGQKQRIAIAMALLKNSKILILDEATSAMDSKTEKKVLDYLFISAKRKTIIVIAHRLSNLNYIDNIIVLENGKIVEKGSKIELLKREGFLKSYFKHQYEDQKIYIKNRQL